MRWWPFVAKETTASSASRALAAAKTEVATEPPPPTEFDQARMHWRTYPATNISPERLLSALRDADRGNLARWMELLDDVAVDEQVSHCLETLKLAVAGAPWEVEPGDDSDQAVAIAEHAERFLKRIPSFTQMKVDLLDAIFREFSLVQPLWTADGNEWIVTGHQAIETRFCRLVDGQLHLETKNAPNGELVPPGIIVAWYRRNAAFLRSGLGRTVAKLWLYKGYNLIDCASYLERFGHPFITIQVPPHLREGAPELERAKDAAKALMADQVGLLPAGVELKFLEAIQKAASIKDVYLAFIAWCEKAIAKAMLGQAETSEMGEGSRARSQVANELRQDRKEAHGGWLDELLNAQLLGPWTVYHYGPTAPRPRICHKVGAPVDEKARAETRKVEAETMAIGRKLGVRLSKAQVYERFDWREPETDDDAIEPTGGEAPPEFAAPPTAKESADLARRHGACPHCGGGFTLAAAEKKKRSMDWGT
jgi:phage gp29-like protein